MSHRSFVRTPTLGSFALVLASLCGCALDGPADAPASTDAPLTAGPAHEVLAAGGAHACAVQTSGRVMCWGQNDQGQLGDGSTTRRMTPVAMAGVAEAVEVAAGEAFTCALTAGGQVWCAGANESGQLGRGGYGGSLPSAAPVTGIADAIAITAAGAHACAIRADGSAVCWGAGGRGQLGGITYAASASPRAVIGVPALTAIDAGGEHTCALDAHGATWCWGAHDGVTPNATPARVSVTPSRSVASGDDGACALDAQGRAQCWGATAPALGTTAWRDLDRGAHACVVDDASRVHCVGANTNGEVGDGTLIPRGAPVPVLGVAQVARVAVGHGFSCARHVDGTVSCWGRGTEGQLGDGLAQSRPIAVPVTNLAGAGQRAIALGDSVGCYLTSGTARCSGFGSSGQLGDGRATSSTTSVGVGTDVDLVDVALGANVSLGLGVDGALYAWGAEGPFGTLFANGPTVSSSTSPVAIAGTSSLVQIAARSHHACALTLAGVVLCWGDNVAANYAEGIFTRSSYSSLVDRPVASGIQDALQIAVGGDHVCALMADGRVLCRGAARFGQLGDGTVNTGYTFYGPRAASGITDAIDVAAGWQHTCAVRASGRVACWGDNATGQLGDGTTTPRSTPVTVAALTPRVEQVVAGTRHTCALAADGGVWCWGANASGQLGDGTATTRTAPRRASGLNDAVSIAAGGDATCAARASGAIVCWGENSQGQLGIGSTTDALIPTLQRSPRASVPVGPIGGVGFFR